MIYCLCSCSSFSRAGQLSSRLAVLQLPLILWWSWGSLALFPSQRFGQFKENLSSFRRLVPMWTLEATFHFWQSLRWLLGPFWFSCRVPSFETLVLVVVTAFFALLMVNAEVDPFIASTILLRFLHLCFYTICNNFDGFILLCRGSPNCLLNVLYAI